MCTSVNNVERLGINGYTGEVLRIGALTRLSRDRARLAWHGPGYTMYFDQVAKLQSEVNGRHSARSAPFLQSRTTRCFL